MTIYNDRETAWRIMVNRNCVYEAAGNKRDTAVFVEGPEDGQAAVMSLREAIENGFCYSWSVRFTP